MLECLNLKEDSKAVDQNFQRHIAQLSTYVAYYAWFVAHGANVRLKTN